MLEKQISPHFKIPDVLWQQATKWLDADPDPATRAALQKLLDNGAVDEIEACFGAPLTFGTAGLRGEVGPGPARMNRLVVRQAAAGFAEYLGTDSTVVIGYDARHNSREFAEDTARVFAATGSKALLLTTPLPTPVLAFAVLWFGADGGVMVTASHNPRGDNGYKVYLGDGAQITPPHDQAIEAAISAHRVEEVQLAEPDDALIVYLDDSVVNAYLDAVVPLAAIAETTAPPEMESRKSVHGHLNADIVYTAMHGVGGSVLLEAFRRAGLAEPTVVTSQMEPNGDFPTLPFPNPEEPGALDEAIAEADRIGATTILANDPDADRLGVALHTGSGWRKLTGNEIGALLGDYTLRNTSGEDRFVATTIVSSRLLQKMAAAESVHYQDTLTGFKWIVRPAIENPALRFVFGYEEALGFLVTSQLRDKDGISAAVMFAQLLEELEAQGSNPLDRLAEIYTQHGVHTTQTWQIRFAVVNDISKLMDKARHQAPSHLGGIAVTETIDYLDETSSTSGVGTDALGWMLGSRARVLLRPSGTEPKAKFYIEVFTTMQQGEDVAKLETFAQELIAAIRNDLTSQFSLPVTEGTR